MNKVRRILVADDDPAIQRFYSDELFEEGYEVITCGDGSRLMDMIRNHLPDLILMDVRLGHENGLDLLQDIKNEYDTLPVILCTAYPAFKDDLKTLAADYYLTKRSNLQELKSTVQKAINGESCAQSTTTQGRPNEQILSHTEQNVNPW